MSKEKNPANTGIHIIKHLYTKLVYRKTESHAQDLIQIQMFLLRRVSGWLIWFSFFFYKSLKYFKNILKF